MSRFFLRDDDANATTPPTLLARVYAPLLDAGHPIAFATIPEAALDTRAPDGTREAFLSPDWPTTSGRARLHAATPLARWLRDNAGAVDVLQHGLSHERVRGGTEMGSLSRDEATARIAAGKAILTEALSRAPDGFVAPWDRFSRGALDATMRSYDFVSTAWVGADVLPARAIAAHVRERVRGTMVLRAGSCRIARHKGGFLSPRTRPEDVPSLLRFAARNAEVAVLVLHHWMWAPLDAKAPEPHPVVRALARALAPGSCARVAEITPARRAA